LCALNLPGAECALRDSRSGAPVRGATAAIGGLALGPDALAATSGGDGSFAIEGEACHDDCCR